MTDSEWWQQLAEQFENLSDVAVYLSMTWTRSPSSGRFVFGFSWLSAANYDANNRVTTETDQKLIEWKFRAFANKAGTKLKLPFPEYSWFVEIWKIRRNDLTETTPRRDRTIEEPPGTTGSLPMVCQKAAELCYRIAAGDAVIPAVNVGKPSSEEHPRPPGLKVGKGPTPNSGAMAPRLSSVIESPVAAQRMTQFLIDRKISLSDFARKAGPGETTIRKFRKTHRARRDILKQIADAMGISLEDLIHE